MQYQQAARNQQPDTAAIIVAAGRSERMEGADKLWAPLADRDGCPRPLISYSLAAFQACAAVQRIVLVVTSDAIERARALVAEQRLDKVCAVVAGGARRRDSVRAGLDAAGACRWVVVHDGARPLVTPQLIERGLDAARETGAACCALPASDTVKEANKTGRIVRTLDRARLWLAQTPQVFRCDMLLEAHGRVEANATDDAALLEALAMPVRLYEGSPSNIKVTTAEDLALVQALLRERS